MVELGNFQKINTQAQNNSKITVDTFTDIWNLNNSSRPGVTNIFSIYDGWAFNWSQSRIKSRFKKIEDNSSKAHYLCWLHEETYKISTTPQISKSTAQGGYVLENIEIPSPSDENAFILALMKAFKNMCNRLGKKMAIIGCSAECEDNSIWEYQYGKPCIDWIASQSDIMIYLYHYPNSVSLAKGSSCTNHYTGRPGKRDAKSYIDYWRNKGYKGKINYIITTLFTNGIGTTDFLTIEADYIQALNAGADIISTYPYTKESLHDSGAVPRLLQFYEKTSGTPNCSQITCSFFAEQL